MKKKQTTVRSSSVVRAKKRGGSGLPGAAQRARSRQVWPTLIAQLWTAVRVKKSAYRDGDMSLYRFMLSAEKRIRKALKSKARRRPLGANRVLSKPGSDKP